MARVLLIDPDPSTALTLTQALHALHIDLESVENGAGGLAAVLERPPTLILLAMDIRDRDPVELLRVLRSRTRTAHIPVFMLAPRTLAGRQNDALQAGADDFILKPFDVDIVSLRVRNAAGRAERDGLTHPRTELPTGRLLEERLQELTARPDWYRIDLEIEHFAEFRHAYGFMNSQELIIFTAGVLADCIRDAGTPDDFIGQNSDTTYVVITDRAHGPALGAQIQQRFDDGALSFYTYVEREQGYTTLEEGNSTARRPLMRGRITSRQSEAP